ncbi:hypothetical protein IM792_11330 [Mucilaginibacter sp. JRF]|uniref:DUF6850 family outer membrane beta-barrel protein n=1 Tax=Mucilaginibacter sp. JRF TaxID=2780088 RepID=UPI0018822DC6|nr:DUF6850 family outer membrane beta-barrel protein [Mucilaginibacter sp. JRF]MBE9585042.1 hypothetical protein [Mucilaginibacter sp. JRF]
MRVFIILLLCTLPLAVSAQIQPDSVLLYGQDRQSVNFASSNATQLISAPYVKLTDNSLSYNTQSGHFRTSQQAENNSAIHFNTNGIQQLGRFKVQGSFDFERMNEDSLANTMRGLSTDVSPYYYMALKAGQYRRLNYTISGMVSYELLPGKLYVASGINYLFNTTSRSVDPRPSAQTYNIQLKPELVYRSGNNYLGLGTDWGYGNENISVGYKNSTYATGNTYPDRFLYLIRGYGYSDRADDYRFKKNYDFTGYHINYSRQTGKLNMGVNLSYSKQKEENVFPLTNSVSDRLFGTFQLNSYATSWLATYTGKNSKHQFYLNTNWQNGYDFNVTLSGSNYKYKNNLIKGGYSIIKHNSNYELVPEVGFNILYNQLHHRDISAGVLVDQSYVQPGLLLALYKKYRNSNRASLRFEPALRLPQQRSITTTPGIFSYFTDNIAFPDYMYYNTKAGLVNAELTFLTPYLFKGVTSGLSVKTTYIQSFDTNKVMYEYAFMPSGHRLLTSFSFNIYF